MNVSTKREKRQKTCSALALLKEQDDAIFLILRFIDFPTLLCIKIVCLRWKSIIVHRVIPSILGRKKFKTKEELCDKVEKYCSVDNIKYADELARVYGWPIGKWNVSQVTNFSRVFKCQDQFNEDISEWDMSNATTLNMMFNGASSFNQDLSQWNTSRVTKMIGTFSRAFSFNGDISTWDTSQVTSISGMFYRAKSFNGDISRWDTSKVTGMSMMFYGASSFHQDISTWNVANVQSNLRLFHGAMAFNHEEHSPRFQN